MPDTRSSHESLAPDERAFTGLARAMIRAGLLDPTDRAQLASLAHVVHHWPRPEALGANPGNPAAA
jgi:hypothetical protein